MRNGFISYAHDDHSVLGRLLTHIASTEERSGIKFWADTDIDAGRQWQGDITSAIAQSDVFLMLVSPALYVSDYIRNTEWPAIEHRVKAGALLIPILIKPCDLPLYLDDRQAVPTSRKRLKAVTTWGNYDEALHRANVQLRDAVDKHFKLPRAGTP